ncbi:hypothetical protein [Mucilaginibacter sp. KACC 22063]|uniref:hypothetical protein n=1 Tax=Mucilaginibacter sp. KACC 22063 TaxID=3025666 RepID=UPI0023671267|nr:hypothetical protein [Mucilaginibacter sp. KACC 22063]WDF55819.1 hypothetical protein PQ461_01930 [Mucilaginibacter sp. KACC 22063]
MGAELKKEELLLLHTKISDLPVSEHLLMGCRKMGFGNLQEIIDLGWSRLMEKRGFTFRWLTELTTLLESRKMLHLLQAGPNPSEGVH